MANKDFRKRYDHFNVHPYGSTDLRLNLSGSCGSVSDTRFEVRLVIINARSSQIARYR